MGFSAFAQNRVAKEAVSGKATVSKVAAGNDIYTGSVLENSAKSTSTILA